MDTQYKFVLLHREVAEYLGNLISAIEIRKREDDDRTKRDGLGPRDYDPGIVPITMKYSSYLALTERMYSTYVSNACENASVVVHSGMSEMFVRARSELKRLCDMVSAGIIDPTGVRQEELLVTDRPSFSCLVENRVLEKMDVPNTLKMYFTKLSQHEEVRSDDRDTFSTCDVCGARTAFIREESTLVCGDCGHNKHFHGAVNSVEQSSMSTKHKSQNVMTHGIKWVYQIQAKEDWRPPAEVFKKLSEIIKTEFPLERSRARYDLQKLTCKYLRVLLKRIKADSEMNNHVPSIRKYLTATYGLEQVVPPQLTDQQEQIVVNDFVMVVETYEEVKNSAEVLSIFNRAKMTNIKYYPYFIYKIIEHRYAIERRLPGVEHLLSCIHIQKPATLKNNDRLWKIICGKRGFKYAHTLI